MTLTEFLLARIAEDEAAVEGFHQGSGDPGFFWGPGRILAVCEAHRRIVDWAAPVLTNWPNAPEDFRYVSDDGLDVLKILALPYAEHPDYREEWRL